MQRRAGKADHLPQRRVRRAAIVQAAAGGVRERQGTQLRAGVVEGEDVAEGHAPLRHGLRAALAHAHAVAPAAEGDGEAVRAFFDVDRLVAGGIDAQAVPRLQRAVGVHVHAELPPIRCFHSEAQFRIQAAGGGVLGRMRINIEDGGDLRPARALPQGLHEALVQPGGVAADGGGLYRGRGVGKVVGVVLDGAVREVSAPDVARGLGLSAVAGAVIAGGDGGTGIEGHVARLVHGPDDAARALVAAKDLVGGGVHHVIGVGRARGHAAQRVVARRHRLRLQRFQGPGGGHLVADYAVEIVLDIDAQDGQYAAAGNGEHEVAAVEPGDGGGGEADAPRAALAACERAGGAQRRQRAVHRQVELPARGFHRGLRAGGDGAGGVAVHIIGAGGGEGQAGARAKAREAHAHHAVRSRQRSLRRGKAAQKQRQRHKDRRRPPPEQMRARDRHRLQRPHHFGQNCPPITSRARRAFPAPGERYTFNAGFSS